MIKKILIWLCIVESEEVKQRCAALQALELEVAQLQQQFREGWVRVVAHMAIEKARYDSVLKGGAE